MPSRNSDGSRELVGIATFTMPTPMQPKQESVTNPDFIEFPSLPFFGLSLGRNAARWLNANVGGHLPLGWTAGESPRRPTASRQAQREARAGMQRPVPGCGLICSDGSAGWTGKILKAGTRTRPIKSIAYSSQWVASVFQNCPLSRAPLIVDPSPCSGYEPEHSW